MIEKLQSSIEYESFEAMEQGIGISRPPSTPEIVDKINEIIDVFNAMEEYLKALANPVNEG